MIQQKILMITDGDSKMTADVEEGQGRETRGKQAREHDWCETSRDGEIENWGRHEFHTDSTDPRRGLGSRHRIIPRSRLVSRQ